MACDRLESRLFFDAVFPTVAAQYELALINRARANPLAEVARLANAGEWNGHTPDLNEGLNPGTISSDPKPPLAMNPNLVDAANKHSQWMIANQNFNHDEGAVGFQAREVAAGYVFGPGGTGSENIGELTATDPTGQALEGEAGFFCDGFNVLPGRGHREALMNPGLNEVGVGFVNGSIEMANGVVTEDFGNANTGVFLCGVTINDVNQNQFYDPGEGLGGVTITATRTSDNAVFTTTSWAAGGYSLKLAPGQYRVTASGGGIGSPAARTVMIGATNVESDFFAAVAPPTTPTAPTITTQPTSQTIAIGNPATFAAAVNANPPVTAQWQVSRNGGPFTNVATGNATGLVYTFTPTADQTGNQYQVVLTNSQGSATSVPATLTISGLPLNITQGPAPQIANAGDTVTFSAAATGSGVTAQWSLSTDGGNTYTPITGATGFSYTFTAAASQNGNWYQVTFTDINGAGGGASAPLTVNAAATGPTINAQPQDASATANGTATLNVAANGFPNPNVQWQVADPTAGAAPSLARARASGQAFVNIPGATGMTLSLPVTAADNHRHYRAVITNDQGTTTTQVVSLNVNSRTPLANSIASLKTWGNAALAAITACARPRPPRRRHCRPTFAGSMPPPRIARSSKSW